MTKINANKKIGLYCMVASILVEMFVVMKIVINIPVKLDTLLLLSWPILPGVAGGYLFYLMDRDNKW